MTAADSLVFVAYLASLLVLGVVSSRLIRGAEDYIVAGRRLGVRLAFATIAATWIGGGITVGVAGKAYEGRAVDLWGTAIGFGTTLILIGLFYAGPLQRLRLYTLADYYTQRFNSKAAGVISSIIMLVAYIFAATAQVVAGSKLLHTVFGWSYDVSVVASGLIVVLYTILGGLWAVALTDALQLSITFTGVLIALSIAVAKASPGNVASVISEEGLASWEVVLAMDFWALVIVLALGDIPAPDLMQRVFASRDPGTARKSSIMAGISYYLMGVTSMLVGASAIVLLPGLEDPELAYPMLIKTVLPVGLSGLVLAGLMAAVMSNADSMMLAPATVVAKNVIKDVVKPDMSDKGLLLASRALVAVIGGVAIAGGLMRANVLYWLILAFDVLFASLFVPLTLGLWWPRFNRAGALSSMLAGASSRVALEYLLAKGLIGPWWVASLGAPLIALAAGVLATLASPAPTKEGPQAAKA